VPAHSLRGMVTYRLPTLPQMKVGARVSWAPGPSLEYSDSRYLRSVTLFRFSDVLQLHSLTDEQVLAMTCSTIC